VADRPAGACDLAVQRAVVLARAGEVGDAEATLAAALARCPGDAGPARELAGLLFTQSRWSDAAAWAERAAALDGSDPPSWRLLAASRFLADDHSGALDAWNRTGEPRLDLVQVDGLTRTRHDIAVRSLALTTGAMLAAADLGRARRRLSALPAAIASRVEYEPVPGGIAQVRATVLERPLLPRSWLWAAATGARALTDREITVQIASPSGGGELLAFGYRWWDHRPRVGLSLAAPAPRPLGGVWTLDAFVEEQAYGAAIRTIERRAHGGLTVSDWITADLRLEGSVSIDRFTDRGPSISIAAGAERRFISDLLSVEGHVAGWSPAGTAPAFGTARLRASLRSALDPQEWALLLRAGTQAASAAAPFALWPGAGTGTARPSLLRAHPLLRQGVLDGPVFGRLLVEGGVELQRWRRPGGIVRPGLAMFVDAGRAWRPASDGARQVFHVDAGAGLRLELAGDRGALRVDTAVGARDGRWTIAAGWQPPWR
jgi:hypothetical protein